MAARVPEPAAALVAFALLLPAAPELRMVLPDRRTLPLLVDVPADALSLPLTDVPSIPTAAPFCLALPLLLPLPPVPFMDGIPRSSKAAATSAALGLPPTRRLPEPLPIAGLLIPPPPPPLLAEETPLAALALGDVGIPVPAMRFLRAARAASAAVVACVVAVPPPPLPPLSADEDCCWRIALRFLREEDEAAADGEAVTVAVEFIFQLKTC